MTTLFWKDANKSRESSATILLQDLAVTLKKKNLRHVTVGVSSPRRKVEETTIPDDDYRLQNLNL